MKQSLLITLVTILSPISLFAAVSEYKVNNESLRKKKADSSFREVNQQYNTDVEPLSTVGDEKERENDPFYNNEEWNVDSKRRLMKSLMKFHKSLGQIDWDKLKDRYILQKLNDSLESRKTNKNDQFNKRRRLSSNNLVESRSYIQKVRERIMYYKKKKVKKSKAKGGGKGKSKKKKYKKCIKRYAKGYSKVSYSYRAYNDDRRALKKKYKKKKKKSKAKGKAKGKGGQQYYTYRPTKSHSNTHSPTKRHANTHSPTRSHPKTSAPMHPAGPSYYGKGKGKYGYPFCDEPAPASPTITPTKVGNPPKPPTDSPTEKPTKRDNPPKPPTDPSPTVNPVATPTVNPVAKPTVNPVAKPTVNPTGEPTRRPKPPTSAPVKVTRKPTISPSSPPTEFSIYDKGSCPDSGSSGVPCSEGTNIRKVCDRYDRELGSFRKCWEICEPSYCCIHDADPSQNNVAPSCSRDENCAQYAYCYVVWYKFACTFGPATYLNVEQDGAEYFFDVPNSEVQGPDKFGEEFFDQLYFHHFNDIGAIFDVGLKQDGTFDFKKIFEDVFYWDAEI